MKKVTLILACLAIFAIVSCIEEKAKTETIIIEKQVETPKAEESDGTSLSVGKEGVEFSTKDGAKKTEVIIK